MTNQPLLQEQIDLRQENAALQEHCARLETEVRALRQDMTALQRHVHMPTTFCTLDSHDDVRANYRSKVLVLFRTAMYSMHFALLLFVAHIAVNLRQQQAALNDRKFDTLWLCHEQI